MKHSKEEIGVEVLLCQIKGVKLVRGLRSKIDEHVEALMQKTKEVEG